MEYFSLKYAGTHAKQPVSIIRDIFTKIHEFARNQPRDDFISNGYLHQSIASVLLSWAMVMSGSGDVEVLRHCRYYSNYCPRQNSGINYGTELAVHSAIGILFLGGCEYTLSNDLIAVSTLFIVLR